MPTILEKVADGLKITQNGLVYIFPPVAVLRQKAALPSYIEVLVAGVVQLEFLFSDTNIAGADAPTVLTNIKRTLLTSEDSGQKTVLARFCRLNGTGTVEMNGDYSAADADFTLEPALIAGPTAKFLLTGIGAFIQDSGSLDPNSYGNGLTLTTGIKVIVRKDGVDLDLLDGKPILANHHYTRQFWEVKTQIYGTGDESLQAIVYFNSVFQNSILLDAALGDKLIVRLRDNFTGLTAHNFKAAGYLI